MVTNSACKTQKNKATFSTIFSLSSAAHLNALELPRLGTKKAKSSSTSEQRAECWNFIQFIQSGVGPMNLLIYKEHGTFRDHKQKLELSH